MFDMTKTGANISKLRKTSDITQMELADRMGISFQAVSNWERGQSMPDIAKLKELSQIFGVSIDDILDNKRTSEILEKLESDKGDICVSKEEAEELAPILKPEQADRMAAGIHELKADDLAALAPFLSQGFIDEAAARFLDKNSDLNSIMPLVPFVSTDILDSLACKTVEKGAGAGSFTAIMPFLSEKTINDIACRLFQRTKDLTSITAIAPFIDDVTLNEIAAEALEKFGLNALSPIMPFIDPEIVEDYIRKHM